MQARNLLDIVISRFTPLLHDDADKLKVLLYQALSVYQDKAGFVMHCRICDRAADIAKPADFLALVSVTDDTQMHVPATAYTDDTSITLTLRGCERYPLHLTYLQLVDFEHVMNFDVPPSAVNVIADYLYILIAIPNSARLRNVAVQSKLDATDLPSEESLYQRKTEAEQKIADNRAVLPPLSVRC